MLISFLMAIVLVFGITFIVYLLCILDVFRVLGPVVCLILIILAMTLVVHDIRISIKEHITEEVVE